MNDSPILYSRVLRDYLLYAADQEIIAITWSSQILSEVTEHLGRNVAGFDRAAGERLVRAMNRAFPFAEVGPSRRRYHRWPDDSPARTRIGRGAPASSGARR